MNNLFPPEIRTASLVNRWSIVRTHNDDPVSGHSYYVTFYAVQIARLLDWQGPLADLMYFAMLHDAEEFITGDILGPVKRAVVDEGKLSNFVREKMSEHLPLIAHQMEAIALSTHGHEIEAIVKVADKVDAVIFLITEIRMGNAPLTPLLADATKNLRAAWDSLAKFTFGPEIHDRLNNWWDGDIWPAIQAHHRYGGAGLV